MCSPVLLQSSITCLLAESISKHTTKVDLQQTRVGLMVVCRTACKQQAQTALATSTGRTSSDISVTELNDMLKQAGETKLEQVMDDCMHGATDGAARSACVSTSAKVPTIPWLCDHASNSLPYPTAHHPHS